MLMAFPLNNMLAPFVTVNKLSKNHFFFFAAVLDCHGELELTMPVGKPLGIVNSLLHPKLWLS